MLTKELTTVTSTYTPEVIPYRIPLPLPVILQREVEEPKPGVSSYAVGTAIPFHGPVPEKTISKIHRTYTSQVPEKPIEWLTAEDGPHYEWEKNPTIHRVVKRVQSYRKKNLGCC